MTEQFGVIVVPPPVNIVYYNNTTGRITGSGQVDKVTLENIPTTYLVVPENVMNCDLTHYVLNGVLTERPLFQFTLPTSTNVLADGNTPYVISGVPVGMSVDVQGPNQLHGVTDDDTVELTFAIIGKYKVTLSLFPYQDLQVTLNAA